jgi:hypothetical protein
VFKVTGAKKELNMGKNTLTPASQKKNSIMDGPNLLTS